MSDDLEPFSDRYELSDKQRQYFAANGHILLSGVAATSELTEIQPAIREAAYRYNTETRDLADRDTYGRAFLQIMNLWRQDEIVKKFVFAKRFARIAADLLGVEKVRLYHDQALFKEPGGGYTPWHQDQYYWPLDTDRTVTMWMPLVDIDEAMGMLSFASGSHLNGPIGCIEISDESELAYNNHIAENGFPVVRADAMNAGDATFHAGWTIHSAGANRSKTRPREVMTVIYFADGARVAPLKNAHQAADLAAWLDSIATCEIANGSLNPVLN
jgi:ectoine hydroxylase-related dioxygenase (phytanoyl-CoA dioxygenase family)